MDWSVVWKYLTVFAVGGALCVPAQLLIVVGDASVGFHAHGIGQAAFADLAIA